MNKPYARMLILALLLIAAWVLWSGYLKPLLLGLGAVSCLLTIWIVRRMGYFDDETFAFRIGDAIAYLHNRYDEYVARSGHEAPGMRAI